METKIKAIITYNPKGADFLYEIGEEEISDLNTFDFILSGEVNQLGFKPAASSMKENGTIILDQTLKYFVTQRDGYLTVVIIVDDMDKIKFPVTSATDVKFLIEGLDKKRMAELINY